MRAQRREDEMGKRFAIVIGVAAAGVMALGAQTAAAASRSSSTTRSDTKVTIHRDPGFFYGLPSVESEVWKCVLGRRR